MGAVMDMLYKCCRWVRQHGVRMDKPREGLGEAVVSSVSGEGLQRGGGADRAGRDACQTGR